MPAISISTYSQANKLDDFKAKVLSALKTGLVEFDCRDMEALSLASLYLMSSVAKIAQQSQAKLLIYEQNDLVSNAIKNYRLEKIFSDDEIQVVSDG